jgi:uncharacterized membrane protein SirB2
MNAAALLLIAIFIALTGFHLFRREYNWIEYAIAGIAIALTVVASFLRMRRRMERKQTIKATRATLLKQKWELHNNREW